MCSTGDPPVKYLLCLPPLPHAFEVSDFKIDVVGDLEEMIANETKAAELPNDGDDGAVAEASDDTKAATLPNDGDEGTVASHLFMCVSLF